MLKKIKSSIVYVLFLVCGAIYADIFLSSIQYEADKTRIKSYFTHRKIDDSLYLNLLDDKKQMEYRRFTQNSAEVELFLRYQLLSYSNLNKDDAEVVKSKYLDLLKTKPTWPYYYSGIAQINGFNEKINALNNQAIMTYGPHERSATLSIAEILFSQWDQISQSDRKVHLNHLINQPEIIISQIVTISDKFAKIYQYCDFIYEQKRIEYAACKQRHWQPLLDK